MAVDRTPVPTAHADVRADLRLVATAAAVGTVAALTPHLFRSADAFDRDPRFMPVVWFGLLLLGPVTAAVVARLRPIVTTQGRALLVGLPQVAVVLAVVMLDQWLELRSGYLLAGSGEVPMAFTFGAILGVVLGGVLALLVAGAARWGAAMGEHDRT